MSRSRSRRRRYDNKNTEIMADIIQEDQYSDVSLEDIQANILQSHGRGYAWHLFLRLNGNQRQIRHWISWLAQRITSAENHNAAATEWQNAKKIGKQKEIDEQILLCFFLSAKGYEQFTFSDESIPGDRSFQLGMKRGEVNSRLKDPPSGKWADDYRNQIDAMVLIAHNSEKELEKEKNAIEDNLKGHKAGKILFVEKGVKLVSKLDNKTPIEHFGYVDGISQPVFLTEEREPITGNLSTVLEKESEGRYGSYLVFRKLEQDVPAFNKKIKALASVLGVSPEEAGARVVGRFPNGTHLSHFDSPQPKEKWPEEKEVNFNDDLNGRRCPLHAHIRKMHHRGAVKGKPIFRIARRGITYEGRPGEKPGLLFMSYQKSISCQFEVLQGQWANGLDFPNKNTGIDPLIGQMIVGEQQQQWPGRESDKVAFSFQDVVALKGGEYFYAPSISYLKNLKFERPTISARGVEGGGRTSRRPRSYVQRMNLKGNLKLY